MIRIATVLLGIFLLISCDKDKDEKLPTAIQAIVNVNNNCACQPVIDKYRYGADIIYLFHYTGPSCNSVSTIYAVNGDVLANSGDAGYNAIIGVSRFSNTVWKCE